MSDFIKLSKREKAVLLAIQKGDPDDSAPLPYSEDILRATIKSLDEKELVKAILTKCSSWGRLTDFGVLYLEDNPKLRDPVDWEKIHSWINTAIAMSAAIISLIALLC